MVADVLQDVGKGMAGDAAERRPGLPCHTSEQLNATPTHLSSSRGGKSQRLARLRVELEIQGLVMRWGAERVGFLTFTFADDVQTIAEAQRRFNSLNSNALSKRYSEWVCVVQRHKDNRIHFHLVVALPVDIRTGFNFSEVARRDYSSVSAYLKAEWKHLRTVLPEYAFGRHELLPIKNPQGFGTYVARYVGNTFHTRAKEKGARLVRFSRGFTRCVCGPFSKVDVIEKRARERLPRIAQYCGCKSVEALQDKLGPAHRYHLARLLYCTDMAFWYVLLEIERSLEFYDGLKFIIDDEFRKYDAYRLRCEAEAEEEKRFAEAVEVVSAPAPVAA